MVQFICFKNLQLSNCIGTVLLSEALNNDFSLGIHIIPYFLDIADEYQADRIQLIIGYPQRIKAISSDFLSRPAINV
jgi:hypothetical protein